MAILVFALGAACFIPSLCFVGVFLFPLKKVLATNMF